MSNTPQPKKTPVPYISELKTQVEFIDKRIAELEDNAAGGAFSPRFLPKDQVEAKKLIARRKELAERIMFYDP